LISEGLQIYHAIKSYAGTKTVSIVATAASIASVIAMAGDKIYMTLGSSMMIHNPLVQYTSGESKDLRATADVLDMLGESIGKIYAQKTGMDLKKVQKLMDTQTYMSASDAVSMGFATDEIDTIAPSFINSLSPDEMKSRMSPTEDQVRAMVAKGFKITNKNKENLSDGEKIAILNLLNQKPITEIQMDITLENILAKAPQLADQLRAEGKTSAEAEFKAQAAIAHKDILNTERERVKAINAMSVAGFESVIAKAIEDGSTPESVSMQIVASLKEKGSTTLQEIANKETATNKVAAAPIPNEAPKTGLVAGLAELKSAGLI